MNINTVGFSVEYGMQYSIYGDAVSICLQNFIIIFLIWNHNEMIKTPEKLVFILAISMLIMVLFFYPLPKFVWSIVLDLSTFLSKFIYHGFLPLISKTI
jgi:hypothetical protein